MSSKHNKMREQRATPSPQPPAADAPTQRGHDALPQRLAHEMANLLDGSLRNLGLAIHSLRGPIDQHEQAFPTGGDEALLHRLVAADHAMKQMVALVNQLRHGGGAPADFGRTQTLAEAVEHAIHLLRPATDACGIAIRVKFAPEAGSQPVGPLYPVILNTLRNSIEAIESMLTGRAGNRSPANGHAEPWIEITGRLDDGVLIVSITDNGPGLDEALFDENGAFRFGHTTRADGHGIGLQLARETIAALNGELTIENIRPHGARVTMRLKRRAEGLGPGA